MRDSSVRVEDLVVDSVCWKAEHNDGGHGGCSSVFFYDTKEGSPRRVACLESRLVEVEKVVVEEMYRKWSNDKTLECFGQKQKK